MIPELSHMTRLMRGWVLLAFVCLAAGLDCRLPENEPKCKNRPNGLAKLPNSDQYLQSIKGLIAMMDSLAGDGGSSLSSFMRQNIADAEAEMSFVSSISSSQQAEIDHVAKVLVPRSFQMVSRFFRRATELKQNTTVLVALMRTVSYPTDRPRHPVDSRTF